MKLEEGMYVRTKQGTIEKVIKRYDTLSGCKVEVNEDFRFKHYEHNYIKHIKNASHNIIDLIEIGDYVNGSKVLDISEDENNRIWIYTDSKNNECCFSESEIEDVVTKEQFNSQKYVVGEINELGYRS